MPVELKVPEVGESITEVQIAQWYKQVGQRAEKDENLVEIESDKATVELPAPVAGTITQILKQPGQRAQVGEVIGYMAAGIAAEAVRDNATGQHAEQFPKHRNHQTANRRRPPRVSCPPRNAFWRKRASEWKTLPPPAPADEY